jgi:DNA-binding MarR family transcriptional regulator
VPARRTSTPTVDVVVDVAGRLRISVTRLARLMRQGDNTGLTPTLAAALATIWREGPLTLGELAAAEQVAPPTITKVVGKLEAQGLVARIPDADDRRVCRVALTDAGRHHVEAVRTRRTAWLAARLAELPPGDLDRLVAAVDVLEHLTLPPDDAPGAGG